MRKQDMKEAPSQDLLEFKQKMDYSKIIRTIKIILKHC